MKLVSLTVVVATVLGAVLGVALARMQVGPVDHTLAPPMNDAPAPATDGPEVKAPRVGAPRLEIDEKAFDFGVMQRGATMSHEFVFRNTGDADLWLEVGSTTCKCTAALALDKPIKPGESAPIKMQWIAKVLSGPFSQRATIHTNDPKNSVVELTVEGSVVERSGLDPSEFRLGKITDNQESKASVYLASYVEEGLEVTATISEDCQKPELFELSVETVPVEELPFEEAKSGVRIDLTVKPGLPIGHLTEWVKVATNQEEIGEMLIPALGSVEGDITLHGRLWSNALGVINLGKVSSQKGLETEVLVSFKGDHSDDAEVRVGRLDPDWLEVEIGEAKKIRAGVTHVPMTLRVPTGRPPVIRTESGQGEGDARIQLLTNHPSTPEIDVRVRFILID